MAQASDEELKSLGLLPNQVFTEEEEQMMENIVNYTPSGVFEPRPRYIESSTPLVDLTKALPENIPIPDDIIDEDLRALIRKDDDRFDEQFRKVADMIRKQLVREYFKQEGNFGRSRRMLKAIEDRRRELEARIAPQDVGSKNVRNWFQKSQAEQKRIGLTQGYLSQQQIQGLPELTGIIPVQQEFRSLSEIKNPIPITPERYMELQLKRSGSRLDPDIKRAVDRFTSQPIAMLSNEKPYIDIEERIPPSEEVMARIKKGGALTQEELEKAIKGMPKGCLPDGCVILKRGGKVNKKFIT